MNISAIILTSLAIIFIAYVEAISAKNLVRLLISLELMFAGVLVAILPLFSVDPTMAFIFVILTLFVSCSELLILITSIMLIGKQKRRTDVDTISVGGDSL